jgi:hypothetical protein
MIKKYRCIKRVQSTTGQNEFIKPLRKNFIIQVLRKIKLDENDLIEIIKIAKNA